MSHHRLRKKQFSRRGFIFLSTHNLASAHSNILPPIRHEHFPFNKESSSPQKETNSRDGVSSSFLLTNFPPLTQISYLPSNTNILKTLRHIRRAEKFGVWTSSITHQKSTREPTIHTMSYENSQPKNPKLSQPTMCRDHLKTTNKKFRKAPLSNLTHWSMRRGNFIALQHEPFPLTTTHPHLGTKACQQQKTLPSSGTIHDSLGEPKSLAFGPLR